MAEDHPPSFAARTLRLLRPSHEHSAYSATVLLMGAVMLSRVIGYLREAYIAWAFGAGPQTDAYVAAFTIPDWLNYLAAGGTASITFISIFTRYLAQGKEEEAQKAFNVVVTIMATVLLSGVLILELFTPQIVRLLFRGFSPEQLGQCVYLTRILLPAQLFFLVGGVVSAVLLSRRLFLFPALGPLIYNAGIILGGVLLSRQLGIASLAVGAVAGAVAGPFLINAIGAAKGGLRFALDFDTSHPGFRQWVGLTIPLMLGVSLVTADEWILRFFASGHVGDITRLNYAKRLFYVPVAVLGQAAGQASLPFFARLWGEQRRDEFAATVNGAVYRVAALSLLVSAWIAAAALPLVDLVYRRGQFKPSDTHQTAVFLFWFGLSLAFWAAQGLYARAFYAASNTVTPMVAGTIITAASLPVYSTLFARYGVVGLAVASDVGIVLHTLVLAALLHGRGLVPLNGLRWGELAKALFAAALAAVASFGASKFVYLDGTRWADLLNVGMVTLTWGAAIAAVLWVTDSELLKMLLRRRAPAEGGPAAEGVEATDAGREERGTAP
jgi:putative peptidoglycan lipid II flippase